MSPLAQKALEIASTQVGEQEKPLGSNWGHPVQDYLASVGIHTPASWCMSLMYWCFNQASIILNKVNPLFKTGGCLYQFQKSKAAHYQKIPAIGDMFIMDEGHGLGHTGIIESIDGNNLHTIEGNTSENGSREGIAVQRKIRLITDPKIAGYLRF